MNQKNSVLAYFELFCDFNKINSITAKLSDFQNLFLVKFCHSVIGALNFLRVFVRPALFRAWASAPAFLCGIFVVFAESANKKMMWIYAKPIIAVVQYAHSLWNFTLKHNPRKPVRFNIFPIYKNPAISVLINAKWTLKAICFNFTIRPLHFFVGFNSSKEVFGFVGNLFALRKNLRKIIHFIFLFCQRAKAAFRACSEVLAFDFPVPALPPFRPSSTACLFFMPQSSATACACQ